MLQDKPDPLDSACHHQFVGIYDIKLMSFLFDARLQLIFTKIKDHPLFLELADVYGEENVHSVDFGVVILDREAKEDQSVHIDYTDIQWNGMYLHGEDDCL